jgi:hypothetical protein
MKAPIRERTRGNSAGVLIWGKDKHDIIRKATELQRKYRVNGMRLDVENAKYHSDIVYLDGRYKQYNIPLVPVHKGTNSKVKP